MVRIAVEREAVSANSQLGALIRASHDRFFEIWIRYGVLILPNDLPRWMSMLESLPPELRKRWQTALASPKYRRIVLGRELPDSTFASSTTLSVLSGVADLACVEETRAYVAFSLEDECTQYLSEIGIEVCRFDCVDQSIAIKRAKALWDRIIFKGEVREKIWDARFSSLSRHATSISIVDRYAGKNMVRSSVSGRLCGLGHFLRLLESTEQLWPIKQKKLQIYVSNKDIDLCHLVETLKRLATQYRSKLSSVVLFVASDREFPVHAHDRFLRFDAIVTAVGRGVSLFAEQVCSANYSCELMVDLDGQFERDVERRLQGLSERIVVM